MLSNKFLSGGPISALSALALVLGAIVGCADQPNGRGSATPAPSFTGDLPIGSAGNSATTGGSGGSSALGNGSGGNDVGGSGNLGTGGSTGGVNNSGTGASAGMQLDSSGGAGGSGTGGNGAGGNAGGGPSQPTGTAHVFTGSTNGRLGAYTIDETDGSLIAAGFIQTGDGLDFINLTGDGTTVFVSRNTSVSAYSYNAINDSFALLDQADTGGSGTHVAVSPSGNLVVVAHYNEGSITALPFVNGQFGNSQGLQPGDNAHQANFDASGEHVFIPCLGSNLIAQYNVNSADNTLVASSPASITVPGGPRHMAFHTNGQLAFSLAELSSEVHVLDIATGTGLLQRRESGSVFTHEDAQLHRSSDVQITADGRFLYAVNRTPSELVRFDVSANGDLSRAESLSLSGTVRSFAIDALGEFVFVGSNAGTVVSYSIDSGTGQLSQSASLNNLGDVHTTILRYLDTP